MHGDLMYLNVLTTEDKELNITSSTRGFYLNQYVSSQQSPWLCLKLYYLSWSHFVQIIV